MFFDYFVLNKLIASSNITLQNIQTNYLSKKDYGKKIFNFFKMHHFLLYIFLYRFLINVIKNKLF